MVENPDLVEKVARAIAKRQGSTLEAMRSTVASKYRHVAEAAIATIRKHDEESGR